MESKKGKKLSKVMNREVLLWREDELPEDVRMVNVSRWYRRDSKVGVMGIAYQGPYENFSSPEQLRTISKCVLKNARWCVIARDLWEWWVIDLETLRRRE